MEKQEAKEQLAYIASVLERSTQYTNISPWSAIAIGLIGSLAGVYSEWMLKGTLAYQEYIRYLAWCWGSAFLLSIASGIAFTRVKAKRGGDKLWVEPIRQGVRHFTVFVFLGGLWTVALSEWQLYFLIPSSWMLCYGGGLYVASLYSLKEIRWLGILFLAAGSVTIFQPFWNQLALLATFGLGHLALGLIVLIKYGKKS